jgi:hypothetical protein
MRRVAVRRNAGPDRLHLMFMLDEFRPIGPRFVCSVVQGSIVVYVYWCYVFINACSDFRVQLCIINIIKYNTNNSNNLNKLSLLVMQLPEHTRRILTFRAKTLCLEFIPTCESSMCVTVLNINKYCLFLKQDVTIMYESNPTAISPPPGNPRAFDLTLRPYRREFDGPVGHLTAPLGI